MIWYFNAASFSCVLVVLFSIVARSKWVGTTLALVLIGVSIYKECFHNEQIIFTSVAPLLIGHLTIG